MPQVAYYKLHIINLQGSCPDLLTCVGMCRYQPGTLNFSSQSEKLVELVGGEKVAVSGDSGDEYSPDSEDHIPREKFSIRLLLVPSRDVPTKTSGTIVYATTAVICKKLIFVNSYTPFCFLE